MNIREVREKIKTLLETVDSKEVFTVLLIILVGFGSFGLGRLSKLREAQLPVYLEETLPASIVSGATARGENTGERPSVKGQMSDVNSSPVPGGPARTTDIVQSGGQLVASKNSTKYHFPWCSGAQRISEANKIWFSSVEEARKAGYTPASNCKGLK